jgi:two-component system, NtrC family, sensor histidine kinase HydH
MNKQHDMLMAVAQIGELVTQTLETSTILAKVVRITARIMKVDVCSIYLFDDIRETLILEATIGLKNDAIGQARITLGEGITGRAAKQGRTVAVSDVTTDKRHKYIPITGEEEYRSLLSEPLKFQDDAIGVMNVQTTNPRTFSTKERRLLKTIAHQVSGLIGNARLFENVLDAKQELEHTQEKLVQSEKMAALGQLAATLSHELRNPLAGLKGAAQLLHRKTDITDSRSQYIRLILGEVDRLKRIAEDLIHFARPREFQYATTDVNQVIEDALLLSSQDIRSKGIIVHNRLSKLPRISVDSDKIKQVIFNIILNALDAMPEGGELFISSGVLRCEVEDRNTAVFQFRDTGDGIPKEVIDRVFEPFYTTKPTGVGLGLAVCRTIVEEHGGRVDICTGDGTPNSGTMVSIELPIEKTNA